MTDSPITYSLVIPSIRITTSPFGRTVEVGLLMTGLLRILWFLDLYLRAVFQILTNRRIRTTNNQVTEFHATQNLQIVVIGDSGFNPDHLRGLACFHKHNSIKLFSLFPLQV